MTKLTAKQEKFCQEFIKCGNASEAYRNSRTLKTDTKPESIWSNACQLLADTKVSQRVFELREKVEERTLVTVESLTEELDEARQMAIKTEQPSAMTGASMGKAKLHGLDVQKIDLIHPITIKLSNADENL